MNAVTHKTCHIERSRDVGVSLAEPRVALFATSPRADYRAAGFSLKSLTRNVLAGVIGLLLLVISQGCNTQNNPPAGTASTQTAEVEVPRVSVSPYHSSGDGRRVSDNPNVFAFVGEKVSLEWTSPPAGTDEGHFNQYAKCKYKVDLWVYGDMTQDTVEFEASAHVLMFPEYEHVLLFLGRHEGKLYHLTHQFFPVYLTKQGRWAGCGNPYVFESPLLPSSGVPIVQLEFDTAPTFDFKSFDERSDEFKEPWFTLTSDRATCRMGAYVEDLFRVKRDGVLTYDSLFHILPDSSMQRPDQ